MIRKTIITLSLMIFLLLTINSAYAVWWNTDWQYRKQIEITVPDGSSLTDYQVLLNVTYESGMQSDFDDLRFTNNCSDDAYEIPYWIENKVDGQYAEVWVKVPTINSTICMYYGNSGAANESDIDSTFLFADDFDDEDFNTSKWTVESGTYTEADGYLQRTDTTSWGVLSVSYTTTDSIAVHWKVNTSTNAQTQVDVRYEDIDNHDQIMFDGINDYIRISDRYGGTNNYYYSSTYVFDTTEFHEYTAITPNTTYLIADLDNGDFVFEQTVSGENIGDMIRYRPSYDCISYTDWFFIRKYHDPEPTYSFGAEETAETNPPSIIIYSPSNTTYYTSNIFLNFIVSDDNSTTLNVTIYLNGQKIYENNSYYNDTTIEMNITVESETLNNLTIYATDSESKTSSETVFFTTDLYTLIVTFSNYTTYNNINYAHTININYSARCGLLNNSISVIVRIDDYANTQYYNETIIQCNNITYQFSTIYTNNIDTELTAIVFLFKDPDIIESKNFTYISDINPPQIIISYNFNYGFRNNATEYINISVSDSVSPVQECNITINTNKYSYLFANNYTVYSFTLSDGTNSFSVTCHDIVNNQDSSSNKIYIYKKNITLINEDDGSVFNSFSDMNTLRAISEKTQEIFNFLENNDTSILFISNQSDVIRIEKRYNTDPNSLLYIDLNLELIDTTTRACVAKTQQFYEIVFYSSTNKPIAVKNNLAQCYVLADYTKYAYQDALMAKAYTIKALYYLYTYENDQKVFLATLDGSVATSVNLDVLESTKKTYTFTLTTDDISVSKISNTTLKIYYKNLENENTKTEIYIYDGDTVLFSHTETETPNEFTIYFDYSSISIQNNILKLVVKKYTQTSQSEIVRIFTLSGAIGLIDTWLAIFISATLIFFGLTFVAVRHIFGFFGIITLIIALAITTLAPATTQIVFIQTIIIIMLIFVLLVYKEEYSKIT